MFSRKQYDAYMAGFRLGFPVKGDEAVEVDEDDPEFQRGLEEGTRNYQENQAARAAEARTRRGGRK